MKIFTRVHFVYGKVWLTLCLVGLVACTPDPISDVENLDIKRGLQESFGPPHLYPFNQVSPAPGAPPKGWSSPKLPTLWAIDNGKLVSSGARHQPLWLDKPLPTYVRIDFEATTDEGGEIRFEVFGDGLHRESGYVMVFGAYGNKSHLIGRLDEHEPNRVVTHNGPSIETDKTYNMTIVRTDRALRWFVENELILQYIDPDPLIGTPHDRFGVDSWKTRVTFDNIAIYELKPTEL